MSAESARLWEGHFQFGDWLDPKAPPDRPGEARTDPDIVANAYLFRSADLVARSAAIAGQRRMTPPTTPVWLATSGLPG